MGKYMCLINLQYLFVNTTTVCACGGSNDDDDKATTYRRRTEQDTGTEKCDVKSLKSKKEIRRIEFSLGTISNTYLEFSTFATMEGWQNASLKQKKMQFE